MKNKFSVDGGIAAISAQLPETLTHVAEISAVLSELSNELHGISEPVIATLDPLTLNCNEDRGDMDPQRKFYFGLADHATPEHVGEVIRTIGRYAGEGSISTLHANLPCAIGNVTLNLLESQELSRSELKRQVRERVAVTLNVIDEAINGVVEPHVAVVYLRDLSFSDDRYKGEVHFALGIMPYVSIDAVVKAAQVTLDQIEITKTQYLHG